MKPDKLDIKIQEAAAQNEAAYDEQAWAAMEKLLDKEMPQKKKDNKKIFWWFLLLFIVIAGLWIITRPGENQKQTMVPEKTNTAAQSAGGADQTLKDQKMTVTQNENDNVASNERPESEQKKSVSEKKSTIIFSTNHPNKKITGSEKENSSGANSFTKIDNNSYTDAESSDKKNVTQPTNESKVSVEGTEPDKSVANENSIAIANTKNDSTTKKNSQDSTKKNKVSGNKNKFANPFLVSVSAGPDISAVSLNDPGKIELLYGAGIGYKINKRWTVRTGFYMVKKGYGAKTSDYHPPAGFWNYYPDLKSIDAICKIYEVPLIVNYNFGETPKHTWFASAGLSSYFMKKEDYSYISKSPTGQTSYHDYTVRNENQHYFSSVRLSAGYEKKVSNKISFTAEPYINLPVSGIGYGKVKLYGAGVLFSLNVKPFSKK
jgi:hypothetical protein